MIIRPLKTRKIRPNGEKLASILDRSLRRFPEQSILAVTSKIVSITEGRVAPLSADKEKLLRAEAEYYLEKKYRRFHSALSIVDHAFISSAGIDESNGAGYHVLLPQDPQKTAYTLYRSLKKRFGRKKFGVIITDSRSMPLRRGATGVALAYRGFKGLKDYRGIPDLFGRKMKAEQANQADALAAAAVAVMGEGPEQTPLALIEKPEGIVFRAGAPTRKEVREFFVSAEQDIFAPLFNMKHLKKGGKLLKSKKA